jgi:hypothetical protein
MNLVKMDFSLNTIKYSKFERKIRDSIFYMYFLLLKDTDSSLFLESISLVFQYLQILYYPFDSYVKIYLNYNLYFSL